MGGGMIKVVIIGVENVGKLMFMNVFIGGKVSEVENLLGIIKGVIWWCFGKFKILKGMKNFYGGVDEFVFIDIVGFFDLEREFRGKVLSEEKFCEIINEIILVDIIIYMVDVMVGFYRGMEKFYYMLKFCYEKFIIVVINKIDFVFWECVEELREIIKKRFE